MSRPAVTLPAGHAMAPDQPASSVDAALSYLRARLPFRPRVGIVLGSGLGRYAERHAASLALEYAHIPGFPPCAIEGHRGRLVCAEVERVPVVIMQGRVHRYEGRSLEEVTRPIRILRAVGIDTLVLSCAAGSLADLPVGHVMLVDDHLNLMGDNPLIGLRPERDGVGGFVEMAGAYDPALLDLAEAEAGRAGASVGRGVLAGVAGPAYETPAEAAMLRRLGAHAVTMSTVPEVIMARALDLRILALALITNLAGVPLNATAAHRQVVATAEGMGDLMGRVLDGVLRGWSVSVGSK